MRGFGRSQVGVEAKVDVDPYAGEFLWCLLVHLPLLLPFLLIVQALGRQLCKVSKAPWRLCNSLRTTSFLICVGHIGILPSRLLSLFGSLLDLIDYKRNTRMCYNIIVIKYVWRGWNHIYFFFLLRLTFYLFLFLISMYRFYK